MNYLIDNLTLGSCMAFTPDGQKLAIANSGDIRVWQVNLGKLLHTFSGPPQPQMTLQDWVNAIAITPDSKTLITTAPLEIQAANQQNSQHYLLSLQLIATPTASTRSALS